MLKYLDELRKRPEGYRRSVAVIFSSAVTGVIFLAWILYITSGPMNYIAPTTASVGGATPVNTIKDMAGQAVDSFKQIINTFGQLKSAIQEAATSTYNYATGTADNQVNTSVQK